MIMNKNILHDVTPIHTERAYQAVTRSIEAKILSGEWVVGAVLPGEFALADAFGVHRSTMREAIRVLEQEGLIHRRPGTKQLMVNAPTGRHVASRMRATIVLQEITFLELWQTMLILEPAAAEAAAVNADEIEIDELAANLEASRRVSKDPTELVLLDMEFLDIIARASRNRVLQLCREPIGQLLYPTFLPVMQQPEAAPRLLQAHDAILTAIRSRNGEGARSWMHRHIVDFRRGYQHANLDINKPVIWPGSTAKGDDS
jgi:DNA-binding FadR family transcriptional regulator